MTERTARADAAGVEIHYRESGDGAPVVLLHGWPQTGACWRRVAPALAARRRVIVPDLPGFGRSARPGSFDAASLAGTIVAFMDAVGAGRAAVVGHDWGGSLTFRLATHHADALESFVVVNAPFRRLDLRRGWHFLFLNVPVVPELVWALAGDRWIDFTHRRASADPGALDDAVLRPYREAFRSWERRRSSLGYYRTVTRRTLVRALRRRLPRPAISAAAPRPKPIETPAMIVWGMKDPALPPHLLDGIARDIPHARIERLKGCGHFVPDECPEALSSLLLDFLG